jgi:hypothetical protein
MEKRSNHLRCGNSDGGNKVVGCAMDGKQSLLPVALKALAGVSSSPSPAAEPLTHRARPWSLNEFEQ